MKGSVAFLDTACFNLSGRGGFFAHESEAPSFIILHLQVNQNITSSSLSPCHEKKDHHHSREMQHLIMSTQETLIEALMYRFHTIGDPNNVLSDRLVIGRMSTIIQTIIPARFSL